MVSIIEDYYNEMVSTDEGKKLEKDFGGPEQLKKNIELEVNKLKDEEGIDYSTFDNVPDDPKDYIELERENARINSDIPTESIESVESTNPIDISNTNQIESQEANQLANIDFSNNKNLIDKYSGVAAYKNNNMTGMTYNDRLLQSLKSKGIGVSKGSSRPSAEGGNYFKFDNALEGMKAYKYLLTEAGSPNVYERLQRWVGTTNPKTNENYASSIMQEAGIPVNNTNGSPTTFSELSNEQLGKLMEVQTRRESGQYINELENLYGGNLFSSIANINI